MKCDPAPVHLGELLTRSKNEITVQEGQVYSRITIRLNGKGVELRDKMEGLAIGTKKQFIVRSGQLLLSKIDARNGAFGIVPPECDRAIITGNFWAYGADSKRLHLPYFDYLTRTPLFLDFCIRASSGTTNRRYLQEPLFLKQSIPLPPLSEQRRIVAKIDELAAKIDEAKRHRRTAEDDTEFLISGRRRLIMNDLLANGCQRLDEAAAVERGKFTHPPRNEPRFFGGDHPWIQIAEIEAAKKHIRQWSETLNDDGLAISRKFPKGTVLISIAATIGAVGILDFDCCVPDSVVALTPRTNTDGEFIYHYLCYLRSHLEDIAPQNTQKNINLRILTPLPFPKIGLTEQHRIVAYLDDLQAKVDALKALQTQSAAELDALLPSVLDKAFKGEL